MSFTIDRLVFTPDDVDLARSPLAGHIDAETYVLGAFNPGMTRLANGNLLMMVRIAEALREPVENGHVHAIAYAGSGEDGEEARFVREAWPLDQVDLSDPRKFKIRGEVWPVMALTSLSWLLPVELSRDGLEVIEVHYDRAIAPNGPWNCFGVEDARISRVGNQLLMTTCAVSPERHSTTLYSSRDGLDWDFEGIVLDHQNKDMLIFEGLVEGQYWAQTRPLGSLWFAYPPGSPYRAGPAINLATSPDGRHWKPHMKPGIRPHAATLTTARMGGGTPPILAEINGTRGWLTLWHGVEPSGVVGIYRTYWSLLDENEPWRCIATSHEPLLEASPEMVAHLADQMYLDNVVFTTGIADAGDHFVVASGAEDLACRITHIPKDVFVPA